MKKLAAILMLATTLATPSMAFARDVSISAKMINYGGPAAYLALYVTKADGTYDHTLWVSGQRAKYYRHLRAWARGIMSGTDSIDGITGASVGSGQTLQINVSIADALIDAGYQVRIDSAVENGGEFSADVIVPLEAASSGVPVTGQGFVSSMTVNM